MALIKPEYTNSVAITISLGSLASTTADPPAGRESNEVDNSSLLFEDAYLAISIKGGTTPTVNKTISVGVWGADYDGSTVRRPAGVTGADANLTLRSAGAYGTMIKPIAAFVFNATTGTVYEQYGLSVCKALDVPVLPIRWGVFVHHDGVAALDATNGNHFLRYLGVRRKID